MCSNCAFYRRCYLFRAGYSVITSPASLAYRDVFVLTADMELQDDVRDDAGNVTSPASGFVIGLRAAGIPVCVLEDNDGAGAEWVTRLVGGITWWVKRVVGGREGWEKLVADRAGWERRVAEVAMARTDQVTVAHSGSVHGLERRVVVWLADGKEYLGDVYQYHSLIAFSRCTTQLLIVDPPPDDSHTKNTDHGRTSS